MCILNISYVYILKHFHKIHSFMYVKMYVIHTQLYTPHTHNYLGQAHLLSILS